MEVNNHILRSIKGLSTYNVSKIENKFDKQVYASFMEACFFYCEQKKCSASLMLDALHEFKQYVETRKYPFSFKFWRSSEKELGLRAIEDCIALVSTKQAKFLIHD